MLLRDAEPICAIRIHLCGTGIHFTFTSLTLALRTASRRGARLNRAHADVNSDDLKEGYPMNVKTLLGCAAVGGLLMLAAPVERAQALSLASPGAATAVQDGKQVTTEVRWRHWGHRRHHHHRHWRRW
jgi:hypothetical protein